MVEFPSLPLPNAPIAIAVDRTFNVECIYWVDTSDAPLPCPAWSVVQIRRSTLREAEFANLPRERYTFLEGNPVADEQAIAYLIRDNAPDFIAGNGGCIEGVRTIVQQVTWEAYQVVTHYETNYEVGPICLVSAISERMNANSDGKAYWVNTRISGGEPFPRERTELLPQWTEWSSVGDAGIGQNVTYELQFCEAEPCTERYYQSLIYSEIEP
jgi:hypothetical protein